VQRHVRFNLSSRFSSRVGCVGSPDSRGVRGGTNTATTSSPRAFTLLSTRYAPLVPNEPYRAPLPIPPDPYAKPWARLKRLRLCALASLLAMFSAVTFGLWTGAHPGIFLVVLLLSLLAALAPASRISAFTCPHCGNAWRWAREKVISHRCGHCGIKVGTPKSTVDDAERRAADVTGPGRVHR
jgi:predicted RNA-binding Zn-ribbon protein involved in translation (DUF1610 family)